jgi:hypothetical protein
MLMIREMRRMSEEKELLELDVDEKHLCNNCIYANHYEKVCALENPITQENESIQFRKIQFQCGLKESE